jgi:hypothetical protein
MQRSGGTQRKDDMTDRELLEAAAKAAEIEGEYRTENLCVNGDWLDVTAIFLADDMGWWNPLTDDGDALRLAVKLRLSLRVTDGGAEVRFGDGCGLSLWDKDESKQAENVRRAIVRAAAAMAAAPAVGAA